MKRTLCAWFFWLLASAAHAQFSSAAANATATGSGSASLSATVAVDTSGSGLMIPSNFVGVSGEVGDFVNGFYQGTTGQWTSNGYTGNAASFISLLNLLGSHGVFRLGGYSADLTPAPTITSGMASNLNSFLGGLGASWTLAYDLDFNTNNPSAAASTAATLATGIGLGNILFQFGNEASLEGFTSAQYITRWNSYYASVNASVPGASYSVLNDIVNATFGLTASVAASLTPGVNGFSLFTEHWYTFCNGTWPTPVPAILFQAEYSNQDGSTIAGPGYFGSINQGAGYLANGGRTGTTGQRMAESNSICDEGQTGMSDRAMAATWYLNLVLILANHGWAGINTHEAWIVPTAYNEAVIQSDNNVAAGPIFYGMYLFSKIEGQQILPSSVGGVGAQAIATKGVNNNANILAVNDNILSTVNLTPQQSASWTTATVLLLSTSDNLGCYSANPTLGGQPIGESGAWTGSTYTITNGQSVPIPPCGAALIEIQP